MKLKNWLMSPALLSLVACSTELPPSEGVTGDLGEGQGELRALHEGHDGHEHEHEECLVSEEVLEHSCLHVTHGPFASVSAQGYPGFVFSDISAPHTAFTVNLPGAVGSYEGGVLYEPAVSGDFAFFVAPGVELVIYDSANQPVEVERHGPVDHEICAGLDEVSVFHLEEGEIYTVVFGPADDASLLTIVEYLGAEGGCESCEHVHLKASADRWPPARTDATATTDHPIHFEIPEVLPVTAGDGRGALARLTLRHGGDPEIRCWYLGHLSAPSQLELAFCNGGLRGGDEVEADSIQLRVVQASLLSSTTEVELELEDESCGEHDHEH